MFGDFAKSQPYCDLCAKEVTPADKMEVEKHTIHKACFKCAFCDAELRTGNCAKEHSLEQRYGPRWFCSDHMLLPPGEKEAQLKKKGTKKPVKPKKQN